jgi:excisionase family DNA binding protein
MAAVARLAGPVRIDDVYLPLVELSKYAGLSVRTLRGYLSDRTRPLPHYRVGGKLLVKRSEFDAWMATFRDQAVSTVDALVDDVLRGL